MPEQNNKGSLEDKLRRLREQSGFEDKLRKLKKSGFEYQLRELIKKARHKAPVPTKKPEKRPKKKSRLSFLIPAVSTLIIGSVGVAVSWFYYFNPRKDIETKGIETAPVVRTVAPSETKPSIVPVEPKQVRAEPTLQTKAEIVNPIPSYEKKLEKIMENGLTPYERKELDNLFSEINKDKRTEKFKSSYQVFREKLLSVIKDYDEKLAQEKAKRKAEERTRKISEADQFYDKYQQDYFNWLKEGITAEERESLNKLLADIDVLLKQYNELAVSRDKTDLVLSLKTNIQKVVEAHDTEQRKVRQRATKYASDLALARSKFSEGSFEQANQIIDSLQKTLEKDTADGLEQLLADVKNLNSEIDKKIELKTKKIAEEEEKLKDYFNQYDAAIADVNAMSYQRALGKIDSLIANLEQQKFEYEEELVKRVNSRNFKSSSKLLAELKSYRNSGITKEVNILKRTFEDVEKLIQNYDEPIAKGRVNELLKGYEQTQALLVNLAKPPYQENEGLRQKVADYNQRISTKLLELSKQKKDYFSRRFGEIKNQGNSATTEAELKRVKEQISALKREYDVFRKSPLARVEYLVGK